MRPLKKSEMFNYSIGDLGINFGLISWLLYGLFLWDIFKLTLGIWDIIFINKDMGWNK